MLPLPKDPGSETNSGQQVADLKDLCLKFWQSLLEVKMKFNAVNNKECQSAVSVVAQAWSAVLASAPYAYRALASFSLWNVHLPPLSPLLYHSTD